MRMTKLLDDSIRSHMRWTGAIFTKCRRRKHCGWGVTLHLQKSCRTTALMQSVSYKTSWGIGSHLFTSPLQNSLVAI